MELLMRTIIHLDSFSGIQIFGDHWCRQRMVGRQEPKHPNQ
jgi:hypothetical protein